MALGTTNLTITQVGTALSNASRVLRVLVIDPNINRWSRYKPGYFYAEATADKFVTYRIPRGAAYTDPRGTNPDSGDDKESYRLGDFRGYDHVAVAANVPFPSANVEFASGTGTSFGISRTFYAEEIDWENDGVYRESHDYAAPITHVHLLDASDDSIQGTAALPAIGGNVTIPLDGVSLTPGSVVTVTYHLAFGVDSTHWHLKLGTNYGAGGIGDVNMLELLARQILGVTFDDTNITGGDNPPYSSMTGEGTTNNYFSGASSAIWEFNALDAFRAYYNGGASYDDFRNISADWYIKGFKGQASTEYLAASSTAFASNGAANTVTLPVSGSPSVFGDGDEIRLILRNISINF